MAICAYRWAAPRADVPESVPVEHVCSGPAGHGRRHRCSCGAILEFEGR